MKATKTPGLYVHTNGVYYLRRQIPDELRDYFLRGTHFKESLRVRDYEAAKPLFAVADATWQARKQVALASLGPGVGTLTPERAADSSARRRTRKTRGIGQVALTTRKFTRPLGRRLISAQPEAD